MAHPNCRVIESGICSITQQYHINGQRGYNYDHWGIDLTDWNGSYNILGWLVAHSDGTVVELRSDCTGYEDGSYGNYVLLKHDNGFYTMYAHGAYGTMQVALGQRVTKGQRLLYMGNTGHSFGGHLHFEVRQPDGYMIDPEPYLNADLPSVITPNVERNIYRDQVEVLDEDLRVRSDAGLNGSILGFASKGFYNYFEVKTADDYSWYKIDDGQWIAGGEWLKAYKRQEKEIDEMKVKILEWQLLAKSDGYAITMFDGIFGNECEAAAKKATLSAGSEGNLVKLVQAVVGANVDGIAGIETANKIALWQYEHGLKADKYFGINCWKKLLGV